MKFKKVPENTFRSVQVSNAEDAWLVPEPDEEIYMLLDKANSDFFVAVISKKPFPRDRDIYFMSPDGVPYKAKKETLEFMSHYRIKAEFERIKEEDAQ